MADNIAVTPGSGATAAADDIGAGVLVQRVKSCLGADGTAVDPVGGAGANSSAVARVTLATDDLVNTNLGGVTEAAPATDTASSGHNGRLQRIAQRITSLIALFPSAIGRTTMAGSLSVVQASDDAVIGPTNESAAATDTSTSGLNGLLKRIAQNLTTVNTTLGSTNSQLPTTPSGSVQTTITRPANTTAYSAGDVLGGALTIATGMTSGQRIMISGADLMAQISAVPSGMTTFRLYLYNVTPPSALADNAAWDLPSGDRASFLGYLDLGTMVDLGSTCFVQNDNLPQKQLQLSGSANLFGYLVTVGGFTPAANSEVYLLRTQIIGL